MIIIYAIFIENSVIETNIIEREKRLGQIIRAFALHAIYWCTVSIFLFLDITNDFR